MSSRYFIRTFRRLFLFTPSYSPFSFRIRHRCFWTSIGTGTLITGAIYHLSAYQVFSSTCIVQAKSLDKDLSDHGSSNLLNSIHRISMYSIVHIEKQFFQAAHDGHLDVLKWCAVEFCLTTNFYCHVRLIEFV
jgi:hypothetical protein